MFFIYCVIVLLIVGVLICFALKDEEQDEHVESLGLKKPSKPKAKKHSKGKCPSQGTK